MRPSVLWPRRVRVQGCLAQLDILRADYKEPPAPAGASPSASHAMQRLSRGRCLGEGRAEPRVRQPSIGCDRDSPPAGLALDLPEDDGRVHCDAGYDRAHAGDLRQGKRPPTDGVEVASDHVDDVA
jgi:hypothetical protein